MGAIERRPLREVLSERIFDGTVNAALFSTYTFQRSYFEDEVLDGFLCERGVKRGRSPVSVLLDADMYEGSGWGYDVQSYLGGRLWHPKVTALMITEQGWGARRRTILAVSSGNLTLSGWETNLELVLALDWEGWTLPKVVEKWVTAQSNFAPNSAFGRWYQKNSSGKPRKFIEEQLISNYEKLDIWKQWGWGGYWSTAHILAPFMDSSEDEDSNETARSYLRTLLKFGTKGRKLHLYLNGAPDGRAYGNWNLLKKLSKEARLKTYVVAGENLHAKLQIVKAEGAWQILGGSPNPTANAMLKDRSSRGNVELAWQTTSASLGGGILPPYDEIPLKRKNFVMPASRHKRKRWRAISHLRYNPKRRMLIASWILPHGESDTAIKYMGKEEEIDKEIILGDDRAVQTLPRDRTELRLFEPDWVPIAFPPEESDDPVLVGEWSLDQIISLLGGREVSTGAKGRAKTSTKPDGMPEADGGSTFPWHDKVSALEEALANTKETIESLQFKRDASYWLRLTERAWKAANPDEEGITIFESSWRRWVRARICGSLLRLDRRLKFVPQFTGKASSWVRHVDPSLREGM